MKKLINSPESVVTDALKGMAAAHPELRVDHENRVVLRASGPVRGKVGLVSGGGSGHEPLHGGFVGTGMLDAACAGEVFTSPTPDQMQAATLAVDGGAGVLHIVKNYTGDIMNFEMAAELAAAEGEVEVRTVVTDDDVAVQDSLYTAGRRGVGVTVLLEKIVGAAAEAGRDLAACEELAKTVNGNGRSMGMALTSCVVPAAGSPTFELAEDEFELGIGIHGEPGRERRKLGPLSKMAEQLLQPVLDDLPDADGAPVIAFVNGMGGTPLIELYGLYAEVVRICEAAGVSIARSLVGPYITSLEMAGASVTLLRADDDTLSLWDAPVSTPGLRWGSDPVAAADVAHLVDWLRRFAAAVAVQERHLTQLDQAIGDADHGSNMRRGTAAVVAALDGPAPTSVEAAFKQAGMTLVKSVGGASGPLYGTFMLRLAGSAGETQELDAAGLGAALRAGLEGVVARGKAQLGDKTMLDVLSPALDAYDVAVSEGADAAAAAAAAAEVAPGLRDATAPLVARKGRASYLGERSAGHVDPGSASTTLLLEALADALAT